MINIIVLAITAACVLFGFILGVIRGFSRSLLRFLLIAVCAAGAWFLRGLLTDIVMGININGQTLGDMIAEGLSSADLPSSVTSLVQTLARLIVGVALFLVCFLLLQLVTWVIIFPLLKLFLKRHPVKRHRITGAVIGLVQGAVIAFVFCFPISGLLVQFNKIASLEMNGEKVLGGDMAGVMEQMDIEGYTSSPLGKFYVSAGGGLFTLMTTDKSGDTVVSLDSATSAVAAAVNVSNEITNISNVLNENGGINGNAQAIADSFKNIDAIKGDLDDESAALLNDVLKDTAASLGGQDFNLPEDFDIKEVNFTAAGDAIVEIEKYSSAGSIENITEDSVNIIINGLAENEIIVDALGSASIASVGEDDKIMFEQAIENSGASDEYKEKIRVLLGLSEAPTGGDNTEGGNTSGGDNTEGNTDELVPENGGEAA